jgi:NTE family protein
MATAVHGVFAGGGVKGIALAGAAAAALDGGYRFERCVGTSSGALVSALVAAGYGAEELRSAVLHVDWTALADPVLVARIPLAGRHLALALRGGLHRGERIERTWTSLLGAKGVATFGDLAPESLRAVATDITHQQGVVLPDDLVRYGLDPLTFPVARAMRMSAAVPFYFRPVTLPASRHRDTSLIADGALTTNFPLRLAEWGAARPVLGFRFTYLTDPHHHEHVRGPASLAKAVITSAIRAAGTIPNPLLERATVVDIPVVHDPLDFRITPADALRLFDLGYRVTAERLAAAPQAPTRPELLAG